MNSAEEEIARLSRNKSRLDARDRAKGTSGVGSPSTANSPNPGYTDADSDAGTSIGGSAIDSINTGSGKRGGKKKVNPEGTARRCANCGQVGHIKTNKKLVYFSSIHPFNPFMLSLFYCIALYFW